MKTDKETIKKKTIVDVRGLKYSGLTDEEIREICLSNLTRQAQELDLGY